MTEHLSGSAKTAVTVLTVLISAMTGLWWGLRLGGALYYVTGTDFRLAFTAVMLAGLLFQGYSSWKHDRRYNTLYRILVWFSGIMVSILIYSLTVIVIGDMVVFIARCFMRIHRAKKSGGMARLLLISIHPVSSPSTYGEVWGSPVWNYENTTLLSMPVSIAVTIYGIIHARDIKTRYYRISLPGIELPPGSPSADPRAGACRCRVVQLSDLHMGSVVNSSYIHRAVRKVMKLRPDYVVITGDIFNHGYVEEYAHPEKTEEDFRRLNDCCVSCAKNRNGSGNARGEARLFATLGNHDPEPDDPKLRQFIDQSHIVLLNDEAKDLPEFCLEGRGGNHMNDRPALSSWIVHPEDGKPIVLLDHYPDGIYEAQKENVDLMLCGHTHRGQYFPCNFLIRKRYSHGLIYGYTKWGNTQNIVSGGTGLFQIPIRVGTDSEINCIDLYRDHEKIQ